MSLNELSLKIITCYRFEPLHQVQARLTHYNSELSLCSAGGHSLEVFRDGMVRSGAQYPRKALSKGCNIQKFSVGDTPVGDEITLHPWLRTHRSGMIYSLDIQGITDPGNTVQGNLIQEKLIMATFTTVHCTGLWFKAGSFLPACLPDNCLFFCLNLSFCLQTSVPFFIAFYMSNVFLFYSLLCIYFSSSHVVQVACRKKSCLYQRVCVYVQNVLI